MKIKSILLVSLILNFFCQSSGFADPQYCNDVFSSLRKYAIKLAERNHMKCLNSGIGEAIHNEKAAWSINLLSPHQWTVEEARPIVVNMIDDFFCLVYTNQFFPVYLREQHKISPKHFNKVLGIDCIAFKIGFWNENIDRYLPPYLAQVLVQEGKIIYYQANPKDQSLQELPFEESFEEAFSRVGKVFTLPCPKCFQ